MFQRQSINPANPDNERGKRTWEWKQADGRQITVYKRNKGESFAAHFHRGDDPAKNPELFLLIHGKMRAIFTEPSGLRKTVWLDATQGKPVELVIQPFVLHEMKAVTDCTYIEYRPRYFNPEHPDTYPAEGFYRLFPAAL